MADALGRAFHWELTQGEIGDINWLNIFNSVEISLEVTFMENRVAMDAAHAKYKWTYPRPKERDVRIDLNACVVDVNGAIANGYTDPSGSTYNVHLFEDIFDDSVKSLVLAGLDMEGTTIFAVAGAFRNESAELNFGGDANDQSASYVSHGQVSFSVS